MRRRDWLFGLATSFALKATLAAADSLSPIDEAGFRRLVSAHRGRVLLVDFWATWCAPCREEMPKLVALHSRYAKELDLVTISCDDPEAATQAANFVALEDAPLPRYIRRASNDDQFINGIDPKWSGALPALFLFDRSGSQVKSFIGETDMAQLEAALKKLLAL
jgi:thiol-disulfide isomerase/thioredoxin